VDDEDVELAGEPPNTISTESSKVTKEKFISKQKVFRSLYQKEIDTLLLHVKEFKQREKKYNAEI